MVVIFIPTQPIIIEARKSHMGIFRILDIPLPVLTSKTEKRSLSGSLRSKQTQNRAKNMESLIWIKEVMLATVTNL